MRRKSLLLLILMGFSIIPIPMENGQTSISREAGQEQDSFIIETEFERPRTITESENYIILTSWGSYPPNGGVTILDKTDFKIKYSVGPPGDDRLVSYLSKNESYLFYADYYAGRLVMYDLENDSVEKTLEGYAWPSTLYLTNNGSYIYFNECSGDSKSTSYLARLDIQKWTVDQMKIFDADLRILEFDEENMYLYAIDNENYLLKIDLNTFDIIKKIRTDEGRYLGINPNKDEVWTCGFPNSFVEIYNSEDLSLKKKIDIGRNNNAKIEFSPTSNVAVIGSFIKKGTMVVEDLWENVSFVDTEKYELLGTFDPGPVPYTGYYVREGEFIGFPLTPDGNFNFSFFNCRIGDIGISDLDYSGKSSFNIDLPLSDGINNLTYRIEKGPDWLWVNGSTLQGIVPAAISGKDNVQLRFFNPFFESDVVEFNITYDSPENEHTIISTISNPAPLYAMDMCEISEDVIYASGNELRILSDGNVETIHTSDSNILKVSCSPEGNRAVILNDDGELDYLNILSGDLIISIEEVIPASPSCMDISPNCTLLAVGDDEGYVNLIDLTTGIRVERIFIEQGRVNDISFLDIDLYNNNNDKIFALSEGNLFHIQIDDDKVEKISENIEMFDHDNNIVQTLNNEGQLSIHKNDEILDFEGLNAEMISSWGPRSALWINVPTREFNFSPGSNIILLLNNGIAEDIIDIDSNVSSMDWSPLGGSLHIGLDNGQLITRKTYDDPFYDVLLSKELPNEDITITRDTFVVVEDHVEMKGQLNIVGPIQVAFLGNGIINIKDDVEFCSNAFISILGKTKLIFHSDMLISSTDIYLDSIGIISKGHTNISDSRLIDSRSYNPYLIDQIDGMISVKRSWFHLGENSDSALMVDEAVNSVSISKSKFYGQNNTQLLKIESSCGEIALNEFHETGGCSLRVTGDYNRIYRNSFGSFVSEFDEINGDKGFGNIWNDRSLVGNLWVDDPYLGRTYPRVDKDGDGISESYLPYAKMDHERFEGDIFPIIQGNEPQNAKNLNPPEVKIEGDTNYLEGDFLNIRLVIYNWGSIPGKDINWYLSDGRFNHTLGSGPILRDVQLEPGDYTLTALVDTGFHQIFVDNVSLSILSENEVPNHYLDISVEVFPHSPGKVESNGTLFLNVKISNIGTDEIVIEQVFKIVNRPDFNTSEDFYRSGGSLGIPDEITDGFMIEPGQNRTFMVRIEAPKTHNIMYFGIFICFNASFRDRNLSTFENIDYGSRFREITFNFIVLEEEIIDHSIKEIIDPPIEDDEEIEASTPVIDPGPDNGRLSPLIPILIFSPVLIGLIAGIGVLLKSEEGRWKLIGSSIPMKFVSLKEKKNNKFTKMRVIDYVFDHPGITVSEISRGISLSYSTVVYHLKVLQKEGTLKCEIDGRLRRIYPTIGRPEGVLFEVTNIQWKILDKVNEKPGISQSDIARKLNEPRQKINFHIRSLQDNGLIRIIKTSGRSLCYLEKPPDGKVIRR